MLSIKVRVPDTDIVHLTVIIILSSIFNPRCVGCDLKLKLSEEIKNFLTVVYMEVSNDV